MISLIYGAYGSNTDRARFDEYIHGSPVGDHGGHRGSSDKTPVSVGELISIPGRLYFGATSKRWNAAVAFVDLDDGADHTTYFQTYRVTENQLRDVARQEAAAPPDHPIELPMPGSSTVFRSAARYGRLAQTHNGVFLITSPGPHPPGVPSVRYVQRIATGLMAAGLDASEVRRYLLAAGVRLSRFDRAKHSDVVEVAMEAATSRTTP